MEFVEFFTQMHWSVIALLAACLVLLIIEGVVPGFGFWGISGIVAGIAAVVCEAIFTKSVFNVFFLIFLILVIFTVLFVIFSHSFSKGFLKKTPLVEDKSALPENYGINQSLQQLVGKEGEVVSICKPVGKAKIDGKIYTVTSVRETIYEGEKIQVVEVENNTIRVEYKGGENE